jgi:hypothetical protein
MIPDNPSPHFTLKVQTKFGDIPKKGDINNIPAQLAPSIIEDVVNSFGSKEKIIKIA